MRSPNYSARLTFRRSANLTNSNCEVGFIVLVPRTLYTESDASIPIPQVLLLAEAPEYNYAYDMPSWLFVPQKGIKSSQPYLGSNEEEFYAVLTASKSKQKAKKN